MYPQIRPMSGQAVAYYGRVSTPKQKLEHQRELVQRWLDHEGIHVPTEWFFEDKEKRHKSEVRESFQRLLNLARQEKLEWIVIAAFDRWGVADPDQFFEFRRELKKHDVRLWSVQDQLDLTGCADFDYQRIINLAIAATMQMGFYAERNIVKMISMALDGWHCTKEHPYGTDMVCYTLHDRKELFRVHMQSKDIERSGPRIYRVMFPNGKEEIVTKMPLRDGKTTGYRLQPSIDKERIENVRLIFELYDQGLMPREIGNHLHAMGRTYFGKFFGPHAIETILKNSAYIGKPAWGKIATGAYRHCLNQFPTKPAERKKGERIRYEKGEEHHVVPREPVFPLDTFIKPDLWDRVQRKLKAKPYEGPRPRRRSKTIHALNGLLVCPECGSRMVVNNTCGKGDTVHYFICGRYAKAGKILCRANSVRFSKVDEAMRICYERVASQLKDLADFKADDFSIDSLLKEDVSNFKLVGRTFIQMCQELGYTEVHFPVDIINCPVEEIRKNRVQIGEVFGEVYEAYEKLHRKKQGNAKKRIVEIDKKIRRLSELLTSDVSETMRPEWVAEMKALEQEKKALLESSMSLVEKLAILLQHAKALHDTIDAAKQTREATLWSTFVEKVVPIVEDRHCKNGKDQRLIVGFEFRPKVSVQDILPGVLEIICPPRGRDSARR